MWILLGLGLLALIAGVGTGCGDGRQTSRRHQLLVIGMDSADWSLLDVLCEQGLMPNLQQFRTEAACGKMLSFRPLEKSPLLWASILTGVRPQQHGVGGFVSGKDQQPVRGSAWRVPAIWDIAGAAGLRSAVIGMWATYPARNIPGVMVSDYLPYGDDKRRPLAGLVWPDSLQDDILGLRCRPEDVTLAELGRFIAPGQLETAEREYPREMADLRSIYASDVTYFRVARWLAEREELDLFIFYQRGPDMISHKFWPYFDPEKSPKRLSEQELAIFGLVVPNYYNYADELLGEVLGWFPPDHPVVLLSDHGFHGPRHQANGWQLGTQEHSQFGIYAVRSPYYEAGTTFNRLELLDTCPSMLALLGIPASQEMPGVILGENLTTAGVAWVRKLAADRVESYQVLRPRAPDEPEVDPEVDEEIRRQLRSLGYIE
ncbi:MAG: alkaline phosphatase family protein [bacterium]